MNASQVLEMMGKEDEWGGVKNFGKVCTTEIVDKDGHADNSLPVKGEFTKLNQ